nr:MAG TPA: hypothetical protein [Caudoviricetes sp.]
MLWVVGEISLCVIAKCSKRGGKTVCLDHLD